jgi:WD40 repeat protein
VYALQIGETQRQKITLPDVNTELDGAQKIERRYAFSHDGKWLARYREQDAQVALLDLSSQGTERVKLSVRGGAVEYQAFSPDDRWLLAHTDTGALLFWDLTVSDPNTTMLTFEGFPAGLVETRFSKSGRWLAVYQLPDAAASIQAGSVLLFDMNQLSASSQPIQLTLADTGYVNLSLSADEKWLSLVGRTGEAQLWDLSQPDFAANPLVIPGYGNQVTAALVSPDGTMLAAGTNAGKTLLWKIEDLLAGNPPLTLFGGSKAFNHLEFSPDGRWLIGSGSEQPILLWHVRFDEALKLACEVVGRNLTPEEWSQNGFTDDYRATCTQWPLEP